MAHYTVFTGTFLLIVENERKKKKENLAHVISASIEKGLTEIIMLEDFNIPDLTWLLDLDTDLPKECRDFLSLLNQYGMTQYNLFLSRMMGNVLDLMISNLPEPIVDIIPEPLAY